MKRSLLTIAVALVVATFTAISAGIGASSPANVPLGSLSGQMPQASPCDLMHGMLGDWRVSGWMMGMDQQKYEIKGTASRRLVPGTTNTVKESVKATVGGKPNNWNSVYTLNTMLGHYQLCTWGSGQDYLGTVEGKRSTGPGTTDEEGNEKAGPNQIEFHGVGWEGSEMDYAITIVFHPTARDADGNPIDRHAMGWEVHSSRIKFTKDMPWIPHSELTYKPVHEGVDPNSPESWAAMGRFSTPGEAHAELMKTVGDWNVKMTIGAEWTGGAGEMVATGTAKIRSVLDGRFVEEEMVTKFPPMEDGTEIPENKARMLMGYHNGTEQFELTYTSSMGTGIDFYRGGYDPELGGVVMYGKQWEASFGMYNDVRVVARSDDDGNMNTEIHGLVAGKWSTIATVIYTKAESKE